MSLSTTAAARSHRVNQVPHGATLGCATCHVNPSGGGARNAFGSTVEASFLTSQDAAGDVIWDGVLAAIDSDGDGFTNGLELGDKEGFWFPGDPDPFETPTAPGDAGDLPAFEGEWTFLGFLDVIDPLQGIGVEGFRVVPEVGIDTPEGPLDAADLLPGDPVFVRGELSRDHSTIFAHQLLAREAFTPISEDGIELPFRGLDGPDIILGEWVRPLLSTAEFVNESTGQALTIDDLQVGDLASLTIGMYSAGHFVTRVAVQPDLSDYPSDPHDVDIDLVFVTPEGVMRSVGPSFDGSTTDYFDESGAAIGPEAVPLQALIAIEFDDSGGGLPQALRVDVIPEDAPWPDGPNIWMQRFAGTEGTELLTFDISLRVLARDADFVFGDGSAASRSDLVDGPVRLVVEPPPPGRLYYADVVGAVTIDPPDFAGPGAPPDGGEPTEFFDSFITHDVLEFVDIDGLELLTGGATLVVEGDVVDGDGNPIAVSDLEVGRQVLAEVIPSTDLELFYAQFIQQEPPPEPHDHRLGFKADVRWVDGNEVGVGDPPLRIYSGATYDDGDTGQSLTLADFAPGDFVEFELTNTDVGQLITHITRNPAFDPGPDIVIDDMDIAFIDDNDRLWALGPVYQIGPGAPVEDEEGNAVDLAAQPFLTMLALETAPEDFQSVVRITVLTSDFFDGGPNTFLERFDSLDGDQLQAISPFPKALAREAVFEFDDGTAASRADVVSGPMRLEVLVPGYNFPHVGEFVTGIVIDPVDFGSGGAPAEQPTQFFGEFPGHDVIGWVDSGKLEVGFGHARIVVEGDVFDDEGSPISVADLRVGERIFVFTEPSIDPTLFFAHSVRQDPHFEGDPHGPDFRATIYGIEGNELIVGDEPRPLLDDVVLFDATLGQGVTLEELLPGDSVDFVMADTDLGLYVAEITRTDPLPLPEGHVGDVDVHSVDGTAIHLSTGSWTLAPDAQITDFDGAAIDIGSIAAGTEVLLEPDPANPDQLASLSTVPEGIFVGNETQFQDRFDRVEGDQVFTYSRDSWPVLREAEITFDDGTPAALGDIGGPTRVLFAPRFETFPHVGEVIEWAIVDPQDFGTGGEPPPQPTEILGEWVDYGALDVIDPVQGIGFGRVRVVVEGDILDGEGNLLTLDDVRPRDALFVEGERSAVEDVIFAHTILVNAGFIEDTDISYAGTVRDVIDGDIYMGDFVRPILDGIELTDGPTGNPLQLEDLAPGDIVEYVIAQTDLGDYVSAIVVDPPDIGSIEPEIWEMVGELVAIDEDGLVLMRGPDVDAAGIDFLDADGAVIDPATIPFGARIAVQFDLASFETPPLVALQVQVVEPHQPLDDPESWLRYRFDSYDGDVLRTLEPFPRQLARDAEFSFGSGEPATRDDLAAATEVSLTIRNKAVWDNVLWRDIVIGIVIDPVFEAEPPPQPTEIFGEWGGLARLDVIDPVFGIGFDNVRVIVEGDIVDAEGNLLALEDLEPHTSLLIDGDLSAFDNVIYARKVYARPEGIEETPTTYGATVRAVVDGELIVGDWQRPLLDGVSIVDGLTGEPIAIEDLQPGDLVDYLIAHTDEGDYIQSLLVNPPDVEEPGERVADIDLAFVDDVGLLWSFGPDFEIAETEFFDAAGEPVDPTTIGFNAPIAVQVDLSEEGPVSRALSVQLLEPGLETPEGWWKQGFDGYAEGVLTTLNPYPTALARDAAITFGDGSEATRDDLVGGPTRIFIRPAAPWDVVLWRDVVVEVVIDPVDFGSGGAEPEPPPQPTEIFGTWTSVGYLDVVDPIKGIGFDRIVVVPEGDVSDPEGNIWALEDLQPGEALHLQGQANAARDTFFAHTLLRNANDLPDTPTSAWGVVREVENGVILLGDDQRPFLEEIELIDGTTGEPLSLEELPLGALSEFEVAHTDIRDHLSRITVHADVGPIEPDIWEFDTEVAQIEDGAILWEVGPAFDIANAEVFGLDGEPIDPATIPYGTAIAVSVDLTIDADPIVAPRIDVLSPNMPPEDPEAWIQHFDSLDGGVMTTLAPFPRPLARDVTILFGDGEPATVADIAGQVRLTVIGRPLPSIVLWQDLIAEVVIGPLDDGTGPIDELEIFGQWDGVGQLDYIDVDNGDVGFGRTRVIVEGDVLDMDGQPIALTDLAFDDVVFIDAQPSIDPELVYGLQVRLDPGFNEAPRGSSFHGVVRDVVDGELIVGNFLYAVLPDVEIYDAVLDTNITLAELQPGDRVEYTILQTNHGDLVSFLGRTPSAPFPEEGWDDDVELAFIDEAAFVWLVGPTFELSPDVVVFDLQGEPTVLATLESGTSIAVTTDPVNPDLAVSIDVVHDEEFPESPDAQLWRFDRVDGEQLFTFDAFVRPLVREVELTFDDGTPATLDDVTPGIVHLSVLHPRRDFPAFGDVVDAIVIGPGTDAEPLTFEEWLPEGEDIDGDERIDEFDYQVYLWFQSPDAVDFDSDGFIGYLDFEAFLLGAGAEDGGPSGDTPITIDFDPADGDQQIAVARGGQPGREYPLQLHVTGAPPVQGWSVTLRYDEEQLAYVGQSFESTDFIDGGLPLVREDIGQVGVGTTVLLSDASGEGDALVGSLLFVVLEGFSGSADIEIVRYGFRPVEGEQLFEAVSWVATITDEAIEGIVGDFDGDGLVDFPDFFLFAEGFWSDDERFDLNSDGFVNFADLFLFADAFGERAAAFKLMALAHEMLGLPTDPDLQQNYPNPFNSSTTLPLLLPYPAQVELEIYDILGQRVRRLVSGELPAGVHRHTWDGRNDGGHAVAGGVYLARVIATGPDGSRFQRVRKLMLTE